MTTPIVSERKKHPQNIRITDALDDDKARQKAQKGIISKQATLVTAGLSDGELQKIVGETMEPEPDQLERINKFTRRAVGPSDVVVFNTLSCNDIVDRDDDQFTTQCVKDFAELPQPLSPIGKSFMLDHNYSVGNAMGRIFGASIEKVSTEAGSATFLMNEVYLPNTEQFQPLIEKIDFGIAWAVSVGVMLGKDACTVCGEGFSSYGYWCRNGHDKGLYYDPNSEETDAWGWPEPTDPKAAGAVKCVRQFMEPRDFYELSQVFLGAQYYAALEEKSPVLAGALKSAGENSFVGASAEEARKLPLRHEPEKVSEARMKFAIEETEDGAMVWKDESDLVWTFDPEDPEAEVLCLGKSSTTKSEEDNEDGSTATGDEQLDPASGGESADDPDGDEDDQSASSGSGELGGEGSGESSSVDDEDSEETTEEEESSDDSDEEKALSKDAVLAAAKAAALDEGLVKAAEDGEGNGLSALLLAVRAENKSLREEKEALAQKATLGDAYLKELRSEAIDWYVKSHVSGDNHAVKTETFEKMLDRFGDDVDLFRSIIEENKELAKAKFPQAVRRSTFPTDPNEKEALAEPTFQKENDEKVRKIHG